MRYRALGLRTRCNCSKVRPRRTCSFLSSLRGCRRPLVELEPLCGDKTRRGEAFPRKRRQWKAEQKQSREMIK